MEYTLEQLRSMSNAEIRAHWQFSKFPFDGGDCGQCLTMHNDQNHACVMADAHQMIRDRMRQFGFQGKSFNQHDAEVVMQNLEEIVALRLFFRNNYSIEICDTAGEIADRELVTV